MKDIKCKKCGLTYDRKYKACPYCKKKRPKTGLFIFIIILIVIAGTAIFYINNGYGLNTRVKVLNDLKIEIKDINLIEEPVLNDRIKIDFDITNIGNKPKSEMIAFTAYQNNYEQGTDSIIISDLLSGKITTEQIYINLTDDEWEKIEIFCSTDYENYEKLYTITKDDIKETQ